MDTLEIGSEIFSPKVRQILAPRTKMIPFFITKPTFYQKVRVDT